MIFKDYGNTGDKVSAVGFGGMRFDLSNSLEENAQLLLYARDKGVNYFDTAPGYCENKSEDIYGIALKQMKREEYFVSTKCMPANAPTVEKAIEAVENSIKRLNCEYIDYYHVWCLRTMEHYHDAMRVGGQYEGLLKCREKGLIRNIVFSSHQPGSEIRHIINEGRFRGVLLGANILNFPYRWDGVTAAYDSGCGVVAMNPLAGGEIPKHEEQLAFLSMEGLTPTESALRFLVCCPQISVTLNGFTNCEHIDTACRVAENATAFTQAEISALREKIGSRMNEICTGCGYCKDCPSGINVPGHMQVYNEHHVFGKDDSAMTKQMGHEYQWGRLVGQQGAYEDCIECGACEQACTQHLPIINRLKEFSKWQPVED